VGECAGGIDLRRLREFPIGFEVHHVMHQLHPADHLLLRRGFATDREVNRAALFSEAMIGTNRRWAGDRGQESHDEDGRGWFHGEREDQ
jgi:hypothetical protein